MRLMATESKQAMTKRERLQALIKHAPVDRPPVAAWQHFLREETDPERFVDATVSFQRRYDWDVIKVNPRAVVFTETWGNRYDYSTYIGFGPKCVKSVIQTADDLKKVNCLPGNYGPLGEQLKIVSEIRKRVGSEVPLIQTVFSPLAILLNLTGTRMIGRYREAARADSPIVDYIQKNPDGMHHALRAISFTLTDYIKRLLEAGADGIFYASIGLAREGYLRYMEWEIFSRKYDLEILNPFCGAFTILHTCGIFANPQRFADYPVSALHWAQSAPGNPTFETSRQWLGSVCAMGGVDERLFGTGAAQEIGRQARQAVSRNKGFPFFLAPECSASPDSLPEEYLELRNAVEL